jgi:hypothetical protein
LLIASHVVWYILHFEIFPSLHHTNVTTTTETIDFTEFNVTSLRIYIKSRHPPFFSVTSCTAKKFTVKYDACGYLKITAAYVNSPLLTSNILIFYTEKKTILKSTTTPMNSVTAPKSEYLIHNVTEAVNNLGCTECSKVPLCIISITMPKFTVYH